MEDGPLKIVRFSSSVQVLASNATATPLQLSGEHRVYSSPVQGRGAQAVLPHLLLLLRWWVNIYVVFVIAVCGVREAAVFETTHALPPVSRSHELDMFGFQGSASSSADSPASMVSLLLSVSQEMGSILSRSRMNTTSTKSISRPPHLQSHVQSAG
jgi:hypothetical protein